jgi:hypothetical protein
MVGADEKLLRLWNWKGDLRVCSGCNVVKLHHSLKPAFLLVRLDEVAAGGVGPVQFTGSRPYHKNDNAHVEQKNWTHVHCLLGCERLECPELLALINALYRAAWASYHNHFCPSMKLKEKHCEGARQIKRLDDPKGPYQRLLESGTIDENKRATRMQLKTHFGDADDGIRTHTPRFAETDFKSVTLLRD